jgi:FlaA1/EpsC-like NDP-sugar epimerase
MPRPRVLPRSAIVLIDLALCLAALFGAYQLRFNFNVPRLEYALLWPMLPVYIAVRLGWYLGLGVQRSMVRHTDTNDARRVFLTVFAGSLTLALCNGLRYVAVDGKFVLPFSVVIIDFMGAALLLITARIAFKLLHLRRQGKGKNELRVVLYGAGESGLITKRALERDGSAKYSVAAFVDDDRQKTGKRLEGVMIEPTSELPRLLADSDVDQVIITVQRPDPENRRQVVDAAMAAGTQVRTVPPVHDWINGQLSSGQIREVRIEDLLGRAPIRLDDAEVRQRFMGRRILVTGAAGSIGSELVRQSIALGAELTLVDSAESPLYDLEMELKGKGHWGFRAVVGDVRDASAMERVFGDARPEVVFHAAAYKHVPLMEAQPTEAVRTNVGGTRILADLALRHGVQEFVLISTDKAVNPTSVMGASKRTAELYVSTLAGRGTAFITTRFGNVLGSNGSVIPLFRRQIAEGGPVTVTDPEVTRYFMTIPEACRLVLEAATMGKGGEIYVFDMGDPVRIADLADKMIRLSGKEPGRDIEVKYTGLRPGEKRYEELLAQQENTLPTHHPRILIGQVRETSADQVVRAVDLLLEAAHAGDAARCLEGLHALVPEYGNEAEDGRTFGTAPAARPGQAQGRST